MINATKLHQELVKAGIPIEGVAATEPPRIDFLPEVTKEQQQLAAEVLAQHVPEDYRDKRQQAYLEAGITIEAMIIALWERIVESRPQASEELQIIRQRVKQEMPKP